MTGAAPLVSIIIVNYGEEQYLLPLLESLRKYEEGLQYEVILLDNYSTTPVPLLLGNRYPEVTVLKQPTNEGFGRTNNTGIKMARGKYLLLLNPDMRLTENCIGRCITYFEQNDPDKTGALSCRLNFADGRLQKSFFRLAASLLNTLQANPVVLKIAGQSISRSAERRDDEQHSKPSEAPWLCGAFLLMRRETVWREHFFFDEDFFLYSEDVELGHRIRRRGYRLLYFPAAAITHFGGGSAPFLRRFDQLTLSEWLCMMKVHGKLYFLINQFLLLLNFLLDGLLFRFATVRGRIRFSDRRAKIIRGRHWRLWRKFTYVILVRYRRRPSSSQSMLTFSAQ
jgi:hypothetical protein